MEKLYINVPAGEDVIEDATLGTPLYFETLQRLASEADYSDDSQYKTKLMSTLLKRNKLIYITDELVEIAFTVADKFYEETEIEIDVESILLELVEDGYFIELGEK